jgi:hypothetical protein
VSYLSQLESLSIRTGRNALEAVARYLEATAPPRPRQRPDDDDSMHSSTMTRPMTRLKHLSVMEASDWPSGQEGITRLFQALAAGNDVILMSMNL